MSTVKARDLKVGDLYPITTACTLRVEWVGHSRVDTYIAGHADDGDAYVFRFSNTRDVEVDRPGADVSTPADETGEVGVSRRCELCGREGQRDFTRTLRNTYICVDADACKTRQPHRRAKKRK
jgi:hypothetical protein